MLITGPRYQSAARSGPVHAPACSPRTVSIHFWLRFCYLSSNMHDRRANAPKRQTALGGVTLAALLWAIPAAAVAPPAQPAPPAPAETVQAQSGFREEVSVGFVLVPTVVRTR